MFSAFLDDKNVSLVGVEPAGKGIETGKHAAPLNDGKIGILHGTKMYLMQNCEGQILDTESVSAGLDYPGVGPEHCFLKDTQRAKYVAVKDEDVLEIFDIFTKCEGILPALESSHSLAWVYSQKGKLPADTTVVVNLSGRGDKDVDIVERNKK
ncbi:MAG: Tryptophan synthase beta chain [Planctomycetes bacterium ADurb.Bin401]|nr:MAG: Tryptophan synthase beta chain [Planctomycetes bacterium ADurb.Bin401]